MIKSTDNHSDMSFFDTDMFIHRLCNDKPVKNYVENLLANKKPTAMSEFSIVEFKGNYIACLILLRRKVFDSDSIQSAFSRVQNSGGRKAALMLAQLVEYIGKADILIKKWDESKNILLTYLDSQISIVWEQFLSSVDQVSRQFKCTRAMEEPEDNDGKWNATIPKCTKDNSKCEIQNFINKFSHELNKLLSDITKLESSKKTDEIVKIFNFTKALLENNPIFHNQNCRSVGDLLIGLESKIGLRLISSNYKEHTILSKSLGYDYQQFEVAKIRSK